MFWAGGLDVAQPGQNRLRERYHQCRRVYVKSVSENKSLRNGVSNQWKNAEKMVYVSRARGCRVRDDHVSVSTHGLECRG
jgi:hypothetical protein